MARRLLPSSHLDPDRQLEVSQDRVVSFLQSLPDNRFAAWQRLQAARAIEAYQLQVLGKQVLDFAFIRGKLEEIARFSNLNWGPPPKDNQRWY